MTDDPPRAGEFFTWEELTTTSTGLANVPDAMARNNLRYLCSEVLDPLRRHLGRPIRVTSGYRAPAVNRAVGGSATSAHVRGEAADIKVEGMTATDIVNALLGIGVQFDQAIAYAPIRGGHVHIGIKAGANARQRRELLWAPEGGGYRPFVQVRPV